MSGNKKPEPKRQEQPPGQEPAPEPYKPMAAPEPDAMERLEAAEFRIQDMETRVAQLERNCMNSHGKRA